MVFCLNELRKKRNKLISKKKIFLCLFYINKRGINIENDKKGKIMRYRISVLLQAKQKGSEVLMPGAP